MISVTTHWQGGPAGNPVAAKLPVASHARDNRPMIVRAATAPLPGPLAHALADALAEAETPLAVDVTDKGPDGWEVIAYFAAAADRDALERAAATAGAGGLDWRAEPVADTDWVALSQSALPAVRVGRILVHGRHARAALRPNDIGIRIEAAEAFGTGHHGTTAGCLGALLSLARARRFGKILDLGTGSGVLAIAAAKLWRAPVLASDVDARAVEIAASNAHDNGVGSYVRTVVAAGFRHARFARQGPFDLILANILAGPLVALAPALARHLAPNGVAILSGLLPGQQRQVLAAYRNQGLRLARATVQDGWLTMTLRLRA